MATNITFHPGSVESSERIDLLRQKGVTIWLTGLSASGKVSDKLISPGWRRQLMNISVYDSLCIRAALVAPGQVFIQA